MKQKPQLPLSKQSQPTISLSSLTLQKHQSRHTKASTNFTLTSLHINSPQKRSFHQGSKQIKLNDKRQKKKQNSQQKVKKSKNKEKKTTKRYNNFDFFIQKQNTHQKQAQISYRQYCLVQDSFLPIKNNNQHKKLQDIMRSTADSTPYQQDFNKSTFRKVFPFKLRQNKSRQKSIQSKDQSAQNIFIRHKQVSKIQVAVQIYPQSEQIGIQYSQRPQISSRQKKEQKAQHPHTTQIQIQTEQVAQQEYSQEYILQSSQIKQIASQSQQPQLPKQSKCPFSLPTPIPLCTILQTLQFTHLPNPNSFSTLSLIQKQHYSQLLQCIVQKLNKSSEQKGKRIVMEEISFGRDQKVRQLQMRQQRMERQKLRKQKMLMMVYKRECMQMSLIQNMPPQNTQQTQLVDSTLHGINTFVINFACWVELHYPEEFLNRIKSMYGCSYRTEYKFLTGQIYQKTTPIQVLDDQLFIRFCEQSIQQLSIYQRVHYLSIFQCMNQRLNLYRPFFQHKGQPFPWSLKLYSSISQYSLDQDSISIIFSQVRQKVEQDVSCLCGLMLDDQDGQGGQDGYNNGGLQEFQQEGPLTSKRSQREGGMVAMWMQNQEIKREETRQMECIATKVMHQLAQDVYQHLIMEIIGEMPLVQCFLPFQFIE